MFPTTYLHLTVYRQGRRKLYFLTCFIESCGKHGVSELYNSTQKVLGRWILLLLAGRSNGAISPFSGPLRELFCSPH